MYFSTISLSCVVSLASAATKPNVVMLLTDDQVGNDCYALP